MSDGMIRMRWAITALGAVIAVVLILSGAVLIGVLLGAMAVMRAVMVYKVTQRRKELRARFPGRTPLG
jgi:Flp pilus assembly protein TadB